MRRRAFLAAGAAGAVSLAGCLGSTTSNTDDSDGDAINPETIDPDADYVVEGPVGKFSARGPLNTDLDGVALHGYDFVAYVQQERPVRGSPDHEVEHDGARFRFASEQHRETFAENPDAYLPAFGGYCSLGVGNGYKDGMHPEAFDIIDGNLYFNLTPSIHQGWLRDHEARIESGEKHWPEIKHSTDRLDIGPGI